MHTLGSSHIVGHGVGERRYKGGKFRVTLHSNVAIPDQRGLDIEGLRALAVVDKSRQTI